MKGPILHSLDTVPLTSAPLCPFSTSSRILSLPRLSKVSLRDLQNALTGHPEVPVVTLDQSWRETLDPRFQPTTVRLAWAGDSLLVAAKLQDLDIFNDAKELNERTWLLGDTFEMFFQDTESEHYVEFHVTPENVRLQFWIPGEGLVSSSVPLSDPCLISSLAWRQNKPSAWFVAAEIPSSAVCAYPSPLAGRRWKFSFCRYDYSRSNPEPVLSSSSALSAASFHHPDEWDTLLFA